MWSAQITTLPGYYVQMGEESLGVSPGVVLGPAGPPCIPSGSDLAPAPTAAIQQSMKELDVTFLPLPENQVANVAVTAGAAGQNLIYSNIGWRTFDCEYLGLYTGASDDASSVTRPAYLVQTFGKRSGKQPVAVHAVDAITGDRLATFHTTPDSVLAQPCGTPVSP